MNTFEFKVTEYFKFSNNQICIGGYMTPDNISYITSEYRVQLITASGEVKNLNLIGEEIFARSKPRIDNKRVLRTADDIEKYLKNLNSDPIKLVGYLDISESEATSTLSKLWK